MLNLHVVGDDLVEEWEQRAVAVAEPSDAAATILAAILGDGAAAPTVQSFSGGRSWSGTVTSQAGPRSLSGAKEVVVDSVSAARVESARGVSPSPDPPPSLSELFEQNSEQVASDGSGRIWQCVFHSKQRLPGGLGLGGAGADVIHTLFLLEFTPKVTVPIAALLKGGPLFAGRLVVVPCSTSDALRNALFDAGAAAVLGGRTRCVGEHAALALRGALTALQSGARLLEAVFDFTQCHAYFGLWGPEGELCPPAPAAT